MDKKFSNCEPTVCNQSFLMSSDGTFMEKEVIKNQCVCNSKSICFEILRLLNEKRVDESMDLLSNIK